MKIAYISVIARHPQALDLHIRNVRWALPDAKIYIFTFADWNFPKDQYPDVKKWTDWEVMKTFPMPYSNFTKEYSIVWRCGVFSKLDQDWRDGAIWFYQKAKNIIFLREHEYYGSFPKKTRQENEKIIKSQLVAFGTRTYEEISRDWGHPYDGDIVKFLTTKWEKERNSIFSFIDETIHMLQQLS
jgi:hypothetical protein